MTILERRYIITIMIIPLFIWLKSTTVSELKGTSLCFYDDIDTWELYDLEEDPKEIHNQIDNPAYVSIKEELVRKLAELQSHYKVTDQEFTPVLYNR